MVDQPKESKFPINRIVAFLGPYIAVASGAVADWLLVHVHLLSTFHTNKTAISGMVTQAVVFGLTAILVWLGQQKWLSGWQQWENALAGETFNGPDAVEIHEDEYDPESIEEVLVEPVEPIFDEPSGVFDQESSEGVPPPPPPESSVPPGGYQQATDPSTKRRRPPPAAS